MTYKDAWKELYERVQNAEDAILALRSKGTSNLEKKRLDAKLDGLKLAKGYMIKINEALIKGKEIDDYKFVKNQAEAYIKDPKTRVFINFNNELGVYKYSVEVVESDGFWLDSFDTYKEAESFIKDNNLKMTE